MAANLGYADGKMTTGFTDGSAMTIQLAGSNSTATGGAIRAVRQADITLSLDMEDGTTLHIQTAEDKSSVMICDKNHALEYAD